MSKPNSWHELIEAIRKRPEMYIYEKSPKCFSAFVDGLRFLDPDPFEVESGFNWLDFERFIEKKYNPRGLTFDSFTLALEQEANNEAAFNLWYKWYDEYSKKNT